MKILIDDKELATFFYKSMQSSNINAVTALKLNEVETAGAINDFLERKKKGKYVPERDNKKFKDKLTKAVSSDAAHFKNAAKQFLENRQRQYVGKFRKCINTMVSMLGEDNIMRAYKNSSYFNFAKGTGLKIDPKSKIVRRKNFTNYQEDCLFRNMEGNENMLITKMNNNWPFWFIDTGYTNFLNGKKKTWHRLVRNNLHHFNMFEAPVDRLGNFESFPQQWRQDGEMILIIEPGSFSARTFGINIKQWKYNVVKELRQYTDRKIVFRPKVASKKKRTNLYNVMLDEDFYCVVNINSNAATEAVWAGIPVITLGKHITNPISRNKLCDIEHLKRPNLANWLAMLSYSQFTYEELLDGTAVNIMRRFH